MIPEWAQPFTKPFTGLWGELRGLAGHMVPQPIDPSQLAPVHVSPWEAPNRHGPRYTYNLPQFVQQPEPFAGQPSPGSGVQPPVPEYGGIQDPGPIGQAPLNPRLPEEGYGAASGLEPILPNEGFAFMEPDPNAEIPATPMEIWQHDYNKATDDYISAQKEAARNAMWINMGGALLANIGDVGAGLAQMGQAAAQYGQTNPEMARYRQGREVERLEQLKLMEQIRASQAPKAPPRPQIVQMDDDQVVLYHPEDRTFTLPDGRRVGFEEYNKYKQGEGVRAGRKERQDEWTLREEDKEATKKATLERFPDMTDEDFELYWSMKMKIMAEPGPEHYDDKGGQSQITPERIELARQQALADPQWAEFHAAIAKMSDEEFLDWIRDNYKND